MKKTIKYLIPLLLSVLFIASCNDGDEGLIQKAMTDRYEEKYKTMRIVGRNNTDNVLYLATDKGIYSFSGNGSYEYVYGDGDDAKYDVLYYDGNSLIKRTKENDISKYYLIDLATKEPRPIPIPVLDGYDFIESYSQDGQMFTILFRDSKGIDYRFLGTFNDLSNISENSFESLKIDNTTIIGVNRFRHFDKNSKKYKYYDDVKGWSEDSEVFYIGYQGDIMVDSSGDYKKGSDELTDKFSFSGKYFLPISNGDNPIYIYPGYNQYIKTEDGSSHTVSGLAAVTPLVIIQNNIELNKYLIITHSHGAFVLDIETNKMTSLRDEPVNFENYQ